MADVISVHASHEMYSVLDVCFLLFLGVLCSNIPMVRGSLSTMILCHCFVVSYSIHVELFVLRLTIIGGFLIWFL